MTDKPRGLTVKSVTASYGRRQVLSDVTFDVNEGELLAVLGPSGCGKTTLLRTIAGLHKIDSGLVALGHRTVANGNGTHISPERRHVGLVPQEGALFPHLNVARNISYGLHSRLGSRSSNIARPQRRETVDSLLELVGLPGIGHVKPAQLSGGQQQRVALARALAPSPQVVLLDEPFSALDAGLRATLRADVRTLLYERNMTSVLVTHDQDEALGMADRIVVMLGGKIAQIGTPEEVYHTPVSLEVGNFVGDSIIVEADATSSPEGWAHTPLGPVPLIGTHTTVGKVLIRPEQVDIAHAVADSEFTVTNVRFTGPATIVTVSDPTGTIRIRSLCPGDRQFIHGDKADVHVKSAVPFYPA
ncbi:ABC transporter ATP-binding protein [Hoyosella rhizosphaerae]|uniref:ABC-type quaternary amine transporter n=1 Tax=Hoyosella rhizosphaerae TaxID=1755582 RepID=A0A916UAN5_9ACTN|nr:ABC transporter ATP-binding protein [Hoyosella rhizosphaerae]MBN4926047.1 ABC transporter ATP-binding protein [Hoyosella rhizosphaerae]GGC65970.1 ABC transporter [Hoyosella rhizosphaerae]